MAFDKKDVRKIKNATQEELSKLQHEYETLTDNVRGMSPVGLFLIAVAGIAVILTFQSNVLDLVGLALFLWPLYIFVRRGAHKEGYFDGYYDLLTKMGGKANDSTHETHEHQDKPTQG